MRSRWRFLWAALVVISCVAPVVGAAVAGGCGSSAQTVSAGASWLLSCSFGVPVITLSGVAFVLFTVWIVLRYAVDPGLSLGLGIAVPLLTTLVLYAISFGLYFVSGLYRRARVVGTELEVWFTEATSADR